MMDKKVNTERTVQATRSEDAARRTHIRKLQRDHILAVRNDVRE